MHTVRCRRLGWGLRTRIESRFVNNRLGTVTIDEHGNNYQKPDDTHSKTADIVCLTSRLGLGRISACQGARLIADLHVRSIVSISGIAVGHWLPYNACESICNFTGIGLGYSIYSGIIGSNKVCDIGPDP